MKKLHLLQFAFQNLVPKLELNEGEPFLIFLIRKREKLFSERKRATGSCEFIFTKNSIFSAIYNKEQFILLLLETAECT